jgi:uncharacterized protein YbaR (Trm112 family)
MNSLVDILACPFCKLGMDEIQARAMEYSIYILLFLIYSLIGIIGFKVCRMMAREERELARQQPGTDANQLKRRSESTQPIS